MGNNRSRRYALDFASWWRYRLDRRLATLTLTPREIVGLYLLFGFGALFLSDVLLARYVGDPVILRRVQAIKGGFEVVLTAGLIFVLTRQNHRSMDRLTDRLERHQEELTVLHRVLRHNLRNDTTLFRGYAELLKAELRGPKHRERCEGIIAVADDIVHYTEQASKIGDVAAENGGQVTVDLARLVPRVVDDNRHATEDVDVSISVPPSARVRANHMLEDAVSELVTNAIVHNDREGPRIVIAVDPAVGPMGYTTLRIVDDGPGIPVEDRLALERRREEQLTHSSGMGLWFVHWTVEMSDGRYHIADADPRGTEIRLQLPKAPS